MTRYSVIETQNKIKENKIGRGGKKFAINQFTNNTIPHNTFNQKLNRHQSNRSFNKSRLANLIRFDYVFWPNQA